MAKALSTLSWLAIIEEPLMLLEADRLTAVAVVKVGIDTVKSTVVVTITERTPPTTGLFRTPEGPLISRPQWESLKLQAQDHFCIYSLEFPFN